MILLTNLQGLIFGNSLKDDDSLQIHCKWPQWIKVNVEQYGYYRVNYPIQMWRNFIDALLDNPETFEPEDRANLLNDAFALAEAGLLSYEIPLRMSTYLRKETHLVPWEAVYYKFERIAHWLEGNETREKWFDQFVISLITGHYQTPDPDDMISQQGTPMQKLWRMKTLSLACRHKYYRCLNDTDEIFLKWFNQEIDQSLNFTHWQFLDPDIRLHILSYGMSHVSEVMADNGTDIWKKVFERYQKETNAHKRDELLVALSFGKWPLKDLLKDLVTDTTKISGQDKLRFLKYLSRNCPEGAEFMFKYLRDYWQHLVSRYGRYSIQLGELTIDVVVNYATNYNQLREVKQFFTDNPLNGTGTRAREIALELIENNIKWRSLNPENLVHTIQQLLPKKGTKGRVH